MLFSNRRGDTMLILKKFISNKKNKVLGLLAVIGLISLFISYETVYLHLFPDRNNTITTQKNIEASKKGIQGMTEYLKGALLEDERKEVENSLVGEQKRLDLEEKQLKSLKKKDYNEFYRLAYLINKSDLEEIKKIPLNNQADNNVLFYEAFASWYSKVKESGQNFPEVLASNASGIGAVGFILVTLGGLSGLVFLTLFCGDVLANEFPNGLRYYHLMKRKRGLLQFQYLFIPILVLMGIIAIGLFIPFTIASFQYGIGSVKFPEFLEGAIFQEYAGEKLLWRIIYLFLVLIFITTLGQLLSQLIKKPYVPSAIIVLILVGYSTLQTQEVMKNLIKWIPLTYLNVNTVFSLSNEKKDWPNTGNFLFGQDSPWIGALMILTCSLIFYLITHLLFKRYIYRKV